MGYQALLFCPDEKLARVVTQVFSELDFSVEPVNELVDMLAASRAYELNARMVSLQDEGVGKLIGVALRA